MISIRKLTEKDHTVVFSLLSLAIHTQFPEYSPAIQSAMTQQEKYWNKRNYRKLLTNTTHLLYGAFERKKLIGFFDVEKPFGGVSFGDWLLVDPAFQKQGIGSLLIKTWEEVTKKQGGHLLYLFCPQRNRPFYEKMGFSVVGKFEKGWFGLDDWICTKLIQEPDEKRFLA